ncbi:facilitated trehalose transporter Tret1-like isoform X2 [Pollicipes pollicipes]|uniref:facilitated trehalose transporter Tret1-like isoform X2 n=1 Tax=Pollicipes pollicipes TaxID=41117 RepID=UPI00188573C5|nr:facilitated trehalose transporter Tret1-like isoform X2 [Pollicipes pollicipes]
MTAKISEGHGGRRGMLMQIITTASFSMTHFNMAAAVAFSGVFTEQLTSEDADLALTVSQVSWIASVFNIGSVVGFITSSYVNPLLGTVRLVQIFSPLVAAGWMLMAFGGSFWVILAGRVLVGVSVGVCLGPTVTHVGEISSVNVRGFLTTSLIVNGCFGITCTYLFGWLLGWRHSCLVIGIGPMALQFLTSLMFPRSARWLVSKGHPLEEAERSLRFYHGQSYDVDKQIEEIKQSLGNAHKHDATLLQVLCLLKHRHNLIPFLLILGLYLCFVFSGGLTATSFAPVVFKDVGGFSNPYIGSILLGVVRTITTVLLGIIMERVGRNTLLMINGLVGAAACLVCGCYFYYSEELVDYGWIALVSILAIVCSMSAGISPLMNVMFSELLPNAIRAELGGVCLLFFGTANFVMVYSFPLVVSSLGMYGVFWFFTAMHLMMFLFAKFFLPDTGGKSIEEIQMMFVKHVVNAASGPVHIHVEERRGSLSAETLDSNCYDGPATPYTPDVET